MNSRHSKDAAEQELEQPDSRLNSHKGVKKYGSFESIKNDNKSAAKCASQTDQESGKPTESSAETQTTSLERLAKRIPCLGILLALCASFFLGSAGMLVKMTHSVHGIQVAVFR